MIPTSWLVVANRSKARFFELENPGSHLKEFHTLHHPKGRVQDQGLVTDRPGVKADGAGGGVHALTPGHDPGEHQTNLFAGEVASVIDEARRKNSLHHLHLIAEPRFLGALRSKLDGHALDLVRTTLDKDVVDADDKRLREYLRAN